MAFMTEAQYFAGRAVTSRASAHAAIDRSVALAHNRLALAYDLLAQERAGGADGAELTCMDTATVALPRRSA
jgi:hypothetical protein